MIDNVPGDDIAGNERLNATKPEDVTNKTFLRAIFGNDAERAWVTDARNNNNSGWFGRRAGDCDVDAPDFVSGDTYFVVGVLRDGAAARTTANWSHTPIIVIDDVDEKCKAPAVIAALGEPSYVLRSSFGSRQFGYILRAPVRDAGTQARIMRAITIGLYGGVDPGHGDNVRYVRLPRGVNSKRKRVAENGGKPQPVLLLEWHPERRHEELDLIMSLDALPGLNGGTAWSEADGAHVTHRAMPANLPRTLEEARATYLPRDYIFAAFDKLDRVVGMQGSAGYIEVLCPWEHTHTNKDDRTGWNPSLFLAGSTAFRCFHSDAGEDQSNSGIETVLRTELDARDGLGSFDALKREAFAATFPPLSDTDQGTTSRETATPQRKLRLVSLGSDAPTTPLRARKTICSFLARGEVTALLGQPATGKSALVLATAFALASDRPDLIGEKSFRRAGDVIIVSNEDDVDVARRRREGWLRQHGINAANLIHKPLFVDTPGFTAASCTDRGSRVELGADMTSLAEDIDDLRTSGRDVCAVVLDTMTSVFDGVPENDNGAMGRVMALLADWAVRNDVAVLLPHHMPKANGRDGGAGDLASARGASALGGGVRLAVTLTALDDKHRAKLAPDMRDRVVQLDGAKANHDAWVPRRYFLREVQDIDVTDEAGNTGRDRVPVMVPFNPKFRWNPKDDNNRLAVLCAVQASEKPGAAPLRVRPGPKCKAAADVLADQLDGDEKGVADTLKDLESTGLLVRGQMPRSPTGNRPLIWIVSAKGHQWIKDKQSSALTAVEDDDEVSTTPLDDTAADAASAPDVPASVS
jgi:AAA domain/RepB DNA-primase from phage plasmid